MVISVSSFSCTHSGEKSVSDKKAGVWLKARRKPVRNTLSGEMLSSTLKKLWKQSNNEVYLT